MALFLALLSAGFYGTADFLGGVAARRAPALAATVAAQGCGLVVVLLAMPLFASGVPSTSGVLWGVAAGLAGGVGVALLYYGFAVGRVSVVAPVTGVCSICIPVVIALILGERPGSLALAGILIAIASVALISRQEDSAVTSPQHDRSIAIALASGLGIGAFFVCLARAGGAAAGLWPLVIARAASTVLLATVATLVRVPLRIPRAALVPAAACGAIDVLANGLYVVAVRDGPLGIIATLASLYPASTVLLARLVLRQRLRPVQSLGLAGATVAVVLITSR